MHISKKTSKLIANHLKKKYLKARSLKVLIFSLLVAMSILTKNLFYPNKPPSKFSSTTSTGEELRIALDITPKQFNRHLNNFNQQLPNTNKNLTNDKNQLYSSDAKIENPKPSPQPSCNQSDQFLFNNHCLELNRFILHTTINSLSSISNNQTSISNNQNTSKVSNDVSLKSQKLNHRDCNHQKISSLSKFCNEAKAKDHSDYTKDVNCTNFLDLKSHKFSIFYAISPDHKLDTSIIKELKPIYELTSPDGFQFLTSSHIEKKQLVMNGNYTENGVIFYLTKGKGLGNSQLYRMIKKTPRQIANTHHSISDNYKSLFKTGPWCYEVSTDNNLLSIDANLGEILLEKLIL